MGGSSLAAFTPMCPTYANEHSAKLLNWASKLDERPTATQNYYSVRCLGGERLSVPVIRSKKSISPARRRGYYARVVKSRGKSCFSRNHAAQFIAVDFCFIRGDD